MLEKDVDQFIITQFFLTQLAANKQSTIHSRQPLGVVIHGLTLSMGCDPWACDPWADPEDLQRHELR
jgi:hypothetical protein